MIKHFCDICGEEIKSCDELSRFRIEERIANKEIWTQLEVHRNCWLEMCKEVHDKKIKTNENRVSLI